MKSARIKSFLILSLMFILALFTHLAYCRMQDEYLHANIVMDGINVTQALDKRHAIQIDPNNGVISKIEYLVTGNHSLEASHLKTVFVIADLDVTSQTDNVDATLSPGDNFTFVQTWKFNNYIGHEKIALITGIYKIRYDLYYSVEGQGNVIKGLPFYVQFDANPLTSVFGVVSTIALVTTGFSFIQLATSLRGSINLELENSIGETLVSPSEKLKGYYKGKAYSMTQAEVSRQLYGYASSLWENEKCPKCEVDWPKDKKECPNCQLTTEEAKELFTTSLVEKSINAIKEVVDSVSGLSLKGIADRMDEGVMPTSSIISVATFSGLTLVKPRVSKNWSKKQRKLIFTGISTSIYALFWVQACGFGVVSIITLIVAVLSGFLIPLIIGRITGNGLKEKVNEFWEKRNIQTS